MPRNIQIAVAPDEHDQWYDALAANIGGLDVVLAPDAAPDAVDYLVYNLDSGLTDLGAFSRLRAIFNTWAGVEKVMQQLRWPAHIPFCRMVEPGLNAGMVEYVCGHVLRYHLDIDRFQAQSQAGIWEKWTPPLANARAVAILGIGNLGQAVAKALAGFGFDLLGWSRRAHDIEGMRCYHGADTLGTVLEQAECVVLLLPLTDQTRGLIDAERLAQMRPGSCLINAGRGPLIDDNALLDALDRGHLRHVTLDVFAVEPLPADHRFWRHPRITVTPHIAAVTRPFTAARAIAEQIARDLAGQPLLHIADRNRGY